MTKTPVTAVADVLARAQTLSAAMNKATDALNHWLAATESAIADLKLGVTARVLMNEADTDSPWSYYLAFGKEKQQWRLLIETVLDGDSDSVTPLVNASRAARLGAVEFLAPLIEKLIETAQEEVKEVQAKTEEVKKLATDLGAIPF